MTKILFQTVEETEWREAHRAFERVPANGEFIEVPDVPGIFRVIAVAHRTAGVEIYADQAAESWNELTDLLPEEWQLLHRIERE